MELIDSGDYQRAVDLRSLPARTRPPGRALTVGELSRLFACCADDDTPAGRRDAAILAILYSGGLRRAEVADLDLSCLEDGEECAAIRLTGKGRKERLVFLAAGALEALRDWIDVRGEEPGPLFFPARRGGHLVARRMSGQAVYDLLKRRAAAAGVASLAPHDLRRTTITHLLDAGAGLKEVSDQAGHLDPKTTARYDRDGARRQRAAAELLHVPYRRSS